MAFVDLSGMPMHYPGAVSSGNNSFATFNAVAIDDTAEKVAFILKAPKTGTINRVGFRFGSVTQAPTNGLTVSLQGVDLTTGDPDGTQDQTRLVESGSIVANTWVTSGLLTSDGTDDGTKRSVLQGETFAVVIEFASFAASDALQIAYNVGAFYSQTRGSQYADLFTASWAKQGALNSLVVAVQYDDNVWEPMPGCGPYETNSSANFASTTNIASGGDERGMKFTTPAAMRACGFLLHGGFTATTGTGQLFLYDDSNTVLGSTGTIDPEVYNVAGNAGLNFFRFEDVENVELAVGTYRVALRATGAGNVFINGMLPDSTDFRTAMPWGTSAVQTARSDESATWTDDSTTGLQYAIGLMINGLDVSSGEGSSGSNTVIVRRFYED